MIPAGTLGGTLAGIDQPALSQIGKQCLAVLNAGEPSAKLAAVGQCASRWLSAQASTFNDTDSGVFADWPIASHLPDIPQRPSRLRLVRPADVPRRRLGSEAGRASLLHAIAHIEFNAIDLAFDMAARFTPSVAAMGLNWEAFLNDWLTVGREEALHFSLINDRLTAFGLAYGDLPAHAGLWDAARQTADSVLARLAIAPMVLEARGLDVTPTMIEKLRTHGDHDSALILQRIYDDEIGHVAIGTSWFEGVCAKEGKQPLETFHQLVAERFSGQIKPPFNVAGRAEAGLDFAFYGRLARQETECRK
ncbi:MAG: ferritin-like domain-containing protein [Pseudomonadota bacterium]